MVVAAVVVPARIAASAIRRTAVPPTICRTAISAAITTGSPSRISMRDSAIRMGPSAGVMTGRRKMRPTPTAAEMRRLNGMSAAARVAPARSVAPATPVATAAAARMSQSNHRAGRHQGCKNSDRKTRTLTHDCSPRPRRRTAYARPNPKPQAP